MNEHGVTLSLLELLIAAKNAVNSRHLVPCSTRKLLGLIVKPNTGTTSEGKVKPNTDTPSDLPKSNTGDSRISVYPESTIVCSTDLTRLFYLLVCVLLLSVLRSAGRFFSSSFLQP